MRIADVLRGKGGAVVTINPEATVAELLAGLAEHNIGAMVVAGPDGLKGIVSERDVVRQLHAHLLDLRRAQLVASDGANRQPKRVEPGERVHSFGDGERESSSPRRPSSAGAAPTIQSWPIGLIGCSWR